MDLQPVITRLQDACPLFKRRVGGAVAAAAAKDGLEQSPAAFVVPMGEKPNRDGSGGLEEIVGEFGVLIGVSVVNAKSLTSSDDFAALSASVRAALEGWRTDGAKALRWNGGGLYHYQPGLLWYLDTYTAVFPQ